MSRMHPVLNLFLADRKGSLHFLKATGPLIRYLVLASLLATSFFIVTQYLCFANRGLTGRGAGAYLVSSFKQKPVSFL